MSWGGLQFDLKLVWGSCIAEQITNRSVKFEVKTGVTELFPVGKFGVAGFLRGHMWGFQGWGFQGAVRPGEQIVSERPL